MKPATNKEKALKDMIALVEELLPDRALLTDDGVKKCLARVEKAKDALEGKRSKTPTKTLKAFRPGVELIAAVKTLRAALAHSPLGKPDPAASGGPNPFVPLAAAVRIARQVRDEGKPFKFDRTGVSDDDLETLKKFFVVK